MILSFRYISVLLLVTKNTIFVNSSTTQSKSYLTKIANKIAKKYKLILQLNRMTLNDRILKLIEQLDISQTKFADKIGVKRQTINNIVAGRTDPSGKVIQGIANQFDNINLEWLIKGEGKMQGSVFSDKSQERTTKYDKEQTEDLRVALEQCQHDKDRLWGQIESGSDVPPGSAPELPERADGIELRAPADSELDQHRREPDDPDEQQVDDEKCRSAPFPDLEGEPPDVSQPDGTPDRSHNEADAGRPRRARRICSHGIGPEQEDSYLTFVHISLKYQIYNG